MVQTSTRKGISRIIGKITQSSSEMAKFATTAQETPKTSGQSLCHYALIEKLIKNFHSNFSARQGHTGQLVKNYKHFLCCTYANFFPQSRKFMQIPAQCIILFGGPYIHHCKVFIKKYMYYFSDATTVRCQALTAGSVHYWEKVHGRQQQENH